MPCYTHLRLVTHSLNMSSSAVITHALYSFSFFLTTNNTSVLLVFHWVDSTGDELWWWWRRLVVEERERQPVWRRRRVFLVAPESCLAPQRRRRTIDRQFDGGWMIMCYDRRPQARSIILFWQYECRDTRQCLPFKPSQLHNTKVVLLNF